MANERRFLVAVQRRPKHRSELQIRKERILGAIANAYGFSVFLFGYSCQLYRIHCLPAAPLLLLSHPDCYNFILFCSLVSIVVAASVLSSVRSARPPVIRLCASELIGVHGNSLCHLAEAEMRKRWRGTETRETGTKKEAAEKRRD